MIFGWITREQYLEHHDPARWPINKPASERAIQVKERPGLNGEATK